jgi:predicted Fe-Mo cluster-binding NifX family protein
MSNTSKTYRIAAASTDGKTIDEHCGKAASFLIFEIGKDGWTCVEKRSVTPLSCGDKHTEEGLLSTIEALKDCTAVIAVKVGGAVKRALEINGISVFEKSDSIDNALSKLAAYYTKTSGGIKNEDGI